MSSNDSANVFKEIFRDHWVDFREKHSKYKTEYYDNVIKKMLGCGDLKNGFACFRCLHCGDSERVAFSCKSSFCLSCAKIYTDKWVDYIGGAFLKGIKYRHLVLTVPDQFREIFYHNPEYLSELMKVGHVFFEDVVSTWLKDSVDVGSIVVLQTAGRSGSYNPHLHILCTSGGLTGSGRWKEFSFIKYKLLHTKWQYHLLKMLRKHVKSEDIEDKIAKCWREYPAGFVAHIEKGDVPDGGQGLARYLAKYVVSPPISLKRIIKYDGEKVRYWYRDHVSQKRVEEEVDVLVFIGRMVQHILPKWFQRIRYYGLQATCIASKKEAALKAALGHNSSYDSSGETYCVTGYRERIKKSFGDDPLLCKRCGNEMELEGIWHPKYGWIVDNWKSFFTEEVTVYGDG